MPKVSEFKNRKNKVPPVSTMQTAKTSAAKSTSTPSKRRPGNIQHAQEMKTIQEEVSMPQHETTRPEVETSQSAETTTNFNTHHSTDDSQTEEIKYFGSDVVKEHAPKIHRSVEIIVEDWKNDGRFEGLPLGHPLFQALASVGLQRAKKIEKKLDERGVFMMAKMGSDIVKMKLNELRGKKQS